MSNTASQVVDKVSGLMGPLEDKIAPISEKAEELDQRIRSLVRSNPALTLFGALCSGYFIGRLVAKR